MFLGLSFNDDLAHLSAIRVLFVTCSGTWVIKASARFTLKRPDGLSARDAA